MNPTPAQQGSQRLFAAMRSNTVMFPLIGAIGLIASVAVARALTPAVFALYATAIALRGTLQFLADLGMGQAAARVFAELQHQGARRQARRLYRQLAAIRVLLLIALAVAVLVAFDAAADLFALRDDEDYFLYFVILIAIAEVAGGLGYSVLSGTLDQREINRVMLAQGIVQPTLVIAAAVGGLGLAGVLTAVVLGSALRAVALNVLAIRRVSSFADRVGTIRPIARSYSRIAASSIIGKLAGWVHSRQIVTIVGLSTTSRPEIAVFALGYDLATQITSYAMSPTSGVLLPVFSASSSEEETRRYFERFSRAMALLLLPVVATFMVILPELIPTLFGSDYSDAVTFGLIFLPGIGLEFILSPVASGLILANDDMLAAYRQIKLLTLVLAGVYVVVLGGDLVLVAALMMCIRVGSAIALQVAIRRRRAFGLDVRWLLRAIACATIAAALALPFALLLPWSVPAIVLAALICLGSFGGLTWLFRLVSDDDAAAAQGLHPLVGRLVETAVRAPLRPPA